MSLNPIIYNKKQYPDTLTPKIEEIAGHFKVTSIKLNANLDYSLHTEYSFKAKDFNKNPLLKNLSKLRSSHKNDVPKLWIDKEWSKLFTIFIKRLVNKNLPPKIIEIHPPFNDYCKSIEQFLDIYKVFEAIILKDYPKTEIFIENRYGTMYSGGKFLISNNKDIMDLSNSLKTTNLKLKIVLDFPQLFASHKINFYSDEGQNKEKMSVILDQLKKIREAIAGIHIWGKRKSNKGRLVAHQGDLNTLFNNNQNLKEVFLSKIYDIFNDGQTRYFVPEVNSGKDDLTSIVNDFLKAGFKFVQ